MKQIPDFKKTTTNKVQSSRGPKVDPSKPPSSLSLFSSSLCLAHGLNGVSFEVKPKFNSLVLGDGRRHPTFTIGNPYFMGPYKPLRNWVDELMSLSPIIWKSWGLIDPIAHVARG